MFTLFPVYNACDPKDVADIMSSRLLKLHANSVIRNKESLRLFTLMHIMESILIFLLSFEVQVYSLGVFHENTELEGKGTTE